MRFKFIDRDDLDIETIQYFWDQGVCMDDWDYMIITHSVENFEEKIEFDDYGDEEKVIIPENYTVSKLLTGCYKNVWYKILWDNKPAIVGVAYHS